MLLAAENYTNSYLPLYNDSSAYCGGDIFLLNKSHIGASRNVTNLMRTLNDSVYEEALTS